ncbi:O-antigen polysaccharide polymerase Wzy [Lacimicrobium sp. SS2-24]|uniref:O-antigen polysaccharide polymerase Wzy n=1 Tax=Lacimicrobium sp. SS2-24 TaxID=2005569 RepID=UPI001FEF9BAE|nr:O-antigen polysaccharide polymerase Wzy [Lacimicrobium sp. SS2-24]
MQFTQTNPLMGKTLAIWFLLMAITLYLGVSAKALELSRLQLEWVASASWLILLLILANTLPRGIWSISFIFFASLGVFHVGLILTSSLGAITDEDILYHIAYWFYRDETTLAIEMVNLALLSFALGALLTSKAYLPTYKARGGSFNQRVYHFGGVLLITSMLGFFALSTFTGVLSSYGAYLNLLSQVPLLGVVYAYLYFFIGLGLVMVSATYRRGFTLFYFALFGLWALVAFRLGLRGEVMFPLMVSGAMFGRRNLTLGLPLILLLLVLFLTVTTIVKNARVSGDYTDIPTVNPLNGVAEMGASLRPVQEVIKWRAQGDSMLYGGSYWAPFERQIALLVPGMQRVPAASDPRMLNVVVADRAGPIGFSPVAEAYANFGKGGVVLIMMLLGAVMGKLDNVPPSTRKDIVIGAALLPVFIMIRNSFTHVPVQVILGITISLLVIFLASTKGNAES